MLLREALKKAKILIWFSDFYGNAIVREFHPTCPRIKIIISKNRIEREHYHQNNRKSKLEE
jgi:hypothetical protein